MMCLSFPDSTDLGCSSNSDMPVNLAVTVMLLSVCTVTTELSLQ